MKESNAELKAKALSKPHPLVNEIALDPKSTTQLAVLQGFVGPSDREGWIRLYLGLNFDEYLEFEPSAVICRRDWTDSNPLNPSVLWVRSDYRMTVGVRVTPATTQGAAFISGSIAEKYLSNRRADILGNQRRAIDQTVGRPSIIVCEPTELSCGPTQIWQCYTRLTCV